MAIEKYILGGKVMKHQSEITYTEGDEIFYPSLSIPEQTDYAAILGHLAFGFIFFGNSTDSEVSQ